MASPEHDAETAAFLDWAAAATTQVVLKIVVFDEADYEWARDFHERWPALPFHLSCGTYAAARRESHTETLSAARRALPVAL